MQTSTVRENSTPSFLFRRYTLIWLSMKFITRGFEFSAWRTCKLFYMQRRFNVFLRLSREGVEVETLATLLCRPRGLRITDEVKQIEINRSFERFTYKYTANSEAGGFVMFNYRSRSSLLCSRVKRVQSFVSKLIIRYSPSDQNNQREKIEKKFPES